MSKTIQEAKKIRHEDNGKKIEHSFSAAYMELLDILAEIIAYDVLRKNNIGG